MSNEWYTPARYIEAAREVLGEIDLDPASCAAANQVVRARRFYTREDNGLMQPWSGRVWLNPPYGRTEQGRASNLEYFTRSLIEQYQAGQVTAAILLVPVNTATRWFEQLWQYPIYFPRFRIRFESARRASNGVAFGSCFVYLGPNEQRFAEVFGRFGPIVRAVVAKIRPIEQDLWLTRNGK